MGGLIMYKKYIETLKFSDYKDHLKDINTLNQTGVDLLLLFYILVTVINLVGYAIAGGLSSETKQMILVLIYSIVIMFIYQKFMKNQKINYTFWLYIFELPLYIYTILMGSFLDPTAPAFTFPFLAIVFPLFIMDRPIHILLQIIIYDIIFLLASWYTKTTGLFLTDALHIVNTTFFAIGANALILYNRIRNIQISDSLKNKSITDPLTGAYNRAGAVTYTDVHEPGLFLYIDLDNFKHVNDQFGHQEGDNVLVQFTQILRKNFRSQDIITRLGGDEFTIFSPGSWSKERASAKCEQLIQAMSTLIIDGHQDTGIITLSIGAIISDGHYANLESLINTADAGMYYVKKHGKNNYHFLHS